MKIFDWFFHCIGLVFGKYFYMGEIMPLTEKKIALHNKKVIDLYNIPSPKMELTNYFRINVSARPCDITEVSIEELRFGEDRLLDISEIVLISGAGVVNSSYYKLEIKDNNLYFDQPFGDVPMCRDLGAPILYNSKEKNVFFYIKCCDSRGRASEIVTVELRISMYVEQKK